MLKIYNSLTNKKEEFTPIDEGKIRMYVCGMTVYDYCHLGHARVMVAFDVVYRYLRSIGYDVTYVRNITDIDDKIIARANENAEPFLDLVNRFIDAMHEDEKSLGIEAPTHEPRATNNMTEILNMISTLIDKGYAYQGSSGDVYYDVSKFENYGALSGRNTDDLRAGERIAVVDDKEDPLDFVLWKTAKPDEPYWDSPWGKGRPGWHIECSAMSTTLLGNNFDIHGGGHDLQFPHHENEIAQSEACTGETFANYWMHNGFIRIDEEKMSKSLGNFFTIREVMEQYRAEDIRYFMLTSQYRSPLNYSTKSLDSAHASLTRLYTAIRGLPDTKIAELPNYEERFHTAMLDDFNTPEALAVLFDLAKEVNQSKQNEVKKAASIAMLMKKLAEPLGLLTQASEAWFKSDNSNDENALSDDDVDSLIEQRKQARADKNWAEADRLRDVLNEHKIIIEDSADGSTWRRS